MTYEPKVRGAPPDGAVSVVSPQNQLGTAEPMIREYGALVGPPSSSLPVRTLVPNSELTENPEFGPSLLWNTGRAVLSEDLHNCLWQFVELGDAPDATIVAFARRYGVLTGSAAETTSLPEVRGWELVAGTEPLAAWRTVATGFTAMLDVATALALPTGTQEDYHLEQLFSAMNAVKTVQWLIAGDRRLPMPSRSDAPGEWLYMDLMEIGSGSGAGRRLWWLINRLLADTEVQPLVAVVPHIEVSRFSLPALALDRLEHPPKQLGRQAAGSDHYWRLSGLLPVLSVALARAVEPGKFAHCARCGRLARVVGRGPDRRRAWFGDHDYCRFQSRSAVMKQVNKRYRDRLVGSQDPIG